MSSNIIMGTMMFHSKQTNLSRPKQTRLITPVVNTNPESNTSTRLMFQAPMIDRVVKAKSGCSACGR